MPFPPVLELYPAADELLRPDDTVLSSFPRSGCSWARVLLADVALQRLGLPVCDDLEFRTLVPSLHGGAAAWAELARAEAMLPRPWCDPPTRLFKSHNLYAPDELRTIYLVRDPADALCSFHDFQRQRFPDVTTSDPDQFCLEQLEPWRRHVATLLELRERRPDRVRVVSYESLHEDPERTLAAMLLFLGSPAVPAEVSRAVARQSFERYAAIEHRTLAAEGRAGPWFYRRGRVGGWSGTFGASTLVRLVAGAEALLAAVRKLEL